jgi:hypothetical protein
VIYSSTPKNFKKLRNISCVSYSECKYADDAEEEVEDPTVLLKKQRMDGRGAGHILS